MYRCIDEFDAAPNPNQIQSVVDSTRDGRRQELDRRSTRVALARSRARASHESRVVTDGETTVERANAGASLGLCVTRRLV